MPQLRDRRALLVLDNFEQVLDAAPAVGALLAGGARRAGPGDEPHAPGHLRRARVRRRPARARTRASSCSAPAPARATAASSPTAAVADVVARVERLPLAIELVASRADRMSAEEMAAGLPILELATGGPRDAPDRHRALRAADRLEPRAARRAGAAAVRRAGRLRRRPRRRRPRPRCSAPRPPTSTGSPATACCGARPARWAMLETLRERALELLGASAPVRARHAAHYLELAERSEPALKGPDQAAWGERVEREHDNLRAALRHAEPLAALRIAAALGFFWYTHGHSAEGAAQLERALAAAARRAAAAARAGPPGARDPALPARRRARRGDLPGGAGDVPRRGRPDARSPSRSTRSGCMARERGDAAGARAAFEEASDALPLARRSPPARRLALQPGLRGARPGAARRGRGAVRARASPSTARSTTDWGVAQNLSGQGALALARGAPGEAAALLAEAVEALRAARRPAVARRRRSSGSPPRRRCAATTPLAARLWGAATAQRDAAGEPRTRRRRRGARPPPRRRARRPRPRALRGGRGGAAPRSTSRPRSPRRWRAERACRARARAGAMASAPAAGQQPVARRAACAEDGAMARAKASSRRTGNSPESP